MIPTLVAVALVSWVGASVTGRWTGGLVDRGMKVGYTRKVFHIVIFSSAAATQLVGGLLFTCAFGAGVAGRVGLALLRDVEDPLFRTLARPADHPKERLLILVPLITTAVSGLASALLFGPVAAVGYLVAGWGDAVGEPVGVRFGRHRYPVPSIGGIRATRSFEGSAAVFTASAAAAAVTLAPLGGATVTTVLAVAVGTTLIEAVSPHGTDNLTVPLVASGIATVLLT